MKIPNSKWNISLGVKDKAFWIVGFVLCIWTLVFLNLLLRHGLITWGLYPRTLRGIPGIFLAPFLHYGIQHALANTIPFMVLGTLVIMRGVREFLELSLFIIVLSGSLVWLLGRPAYHIGASGLIMGYFGYLIARGWYERSPVSALVAIIVIMLYGGALWGILPTAWGVSWEMHLFGLISGVIAAKILSLDMDDAAARNAET